MFFFKQITDPFSYCMFFLSFCYPSFTYVLIMSLNDLTKVPPFSVKHPISSNDVSLYSNGSKMFWEQKKKSLNKQLINIINTSRTKQTLENFQNLPGPRGKYDFFDRLLKQQILFAQNH